MWRRSRLLAALALAAGALLAACGGSEEDPPAAATAQSQAQAQVESAAPPDGEQAQESQPREEAQAQAGVPGQAIDQSQSVPDEEESGAPGSEEQAVEQAGEQAEPQAEEQAQAQAEEQAEEQAAAEEGPFDAAALLSQLFLADLSGLSDYRFHATLDLVVVAEDPENRSFDLITALGGFRFSGVVVPPDTFELTIEFGRSGAGGLPPFGVVQTGGALYTSFGFGWELQPPEAEFMELASVLVEIDAFGFDVATILDAIAEQGMVPALTDAGAFPIEVLREALEPLGPSEIDGRPVQQYRIDASGLSEIIGAIVDPRRLEEQLGLDGIYGGIRDADVVLYVAEEDGLLLRVVADLRRPNVDTDFYGDEGAALALSEFRIATLHFEMDVHPELGVPVRILIEMPEFEVYGDAPYAGSLRLEITIDDLNAGNVTVEPPI